MTAARNGGPTQPPDDIWLMIRDLFASAFKRLDNLERQVAALRSTAPPTAGECDQRPAND